MELPSEIQEQFDTIFIDNEDYFDAGNYEKCIAIHEEAWALFPDSKYNYPEEGYALIQGLVYLNLKIGNIVGAEKWARQLFLFDQTHFYGTSEFALGQVYYELGKLEEAKKEFAIALFKSEGRVFEGKDSKYLRLLKD